MASCFKSFVLPVAYTLAREAFGNPSSDAEKVASLKQLII